MPKQLENNGLTDKELSLIKIFLWRLLESYTREAWN